MRDFLVTIALLVISVSAVLPEPAVAFTSHFLSIVNKTNKCADISAVFILLDGKRAVHQSIFKPGTGTNFTPGARTEPRAKIEVHVRKEADCSGGHDRHSRAGYQVDISVSRFLPIRTVLSRKLRRRLPNRSTIATSSIPSPGPWSIAVASLRPDRRASSRQPPCE